MLKRKQKRLTSSRFRPLAITLCCLATNQLSANQELKAGPLTFPDGISSTIRLIGSDMYSHPIYLAGKGTIQSDSGTINTFAGPLQGQGTLTFDGADKTSLFILTNAGTGFTGHILLNGGTLNVSGHEPLGTGPITISGGQLVFLPHSTTQLSNNLNLMDQQPISLAEGATVQLTGQIISSPFLFNGPGTLLLGGQAQNSFGGEFFMNGGTIHASGEGPLGSQSDRFHYNVGKIILTGQGNYPNTLVLHNAPTIQMTEGSLSRFTGSLEGAGPITLQGAGGHLYVLGDNSGYLGDWNLVSGTLATNRANGLGTDQTITFNGGALQFLSTLDFTTPLHFLVNQEGGTFLLDSGTETHFEQTSSLAGTGPLTFRGSTGERVGSIDLTAVDTSAFTGTFNIQAGANVGVNDLNDRPIFFDGGHVTLLGNSSTYCNPITLQSGGTITQAGSSNTIASNITGNGSLNYNGAGTLRLTGSNDYQGGTLLSGGTIETTGVNPMGSGPLQFQGGHLTLTGPSSLSTPIVFNHPTLLNLKSSATFTGPLSGAGGFTLNGGGTLSVFGTHNSAFNGPITLTSGTLVTSGHAPLGTGVLVLTSSGLLKLSGDTSLPNTLLLTSNGTIQTDNGTTTLTSRAAGLGNASLTKTGNGTLVFNGFGGYSGPTHISGGTFILNGSLAGQVNVHRDATLQGGGTLTNKLNVSGTLAPGNGTGTMTADSVVFQADSTLQILADRTQRSSLLSIGDVSINPAARLVATVDPSFAGQYVVVQSVEGSIKGQFQPLSLQTPRMSVSMLYFPQATILDVSFTPFANLLLKGNLHNIAVCFDQAATQQTPDMINVLSTLNSLTVGQLPAAFNQFDPSFYNVLSFAEQSVSEKVRDSFTQHIYERVYDPEFLNDMFVTFFGEKVHQDSFGTIPSKSGYDDVFSGFLLGFDRFLNHDLLASAGFSYARSRVDWSFASAKSTIDSYTGYLGASWLSTNLILDAYGSYTLHVPDGSRSIFILPNVLPPPFHNNNNHPIDRKLTFDGNGECYTAHLGGISKQFINFTPFYLLAYLNIDYLWLKQQAFTEQRGGVLSLQIQEKTADLLRPESGFGFGYAGKVYGQEVAFVEVDVAYVGMFRFRGQQTKASFVGNDCVFIVKGIQPNHNLVRPTVRFGISSSFGLDVAFNYSGSFGNRYSENEGKIEFTYLF